MHRYFSFFVHQRHLAHLGTLVAGNQRLQRRLGAVALSHQFDAHRPEGYIGQ